jgi:hypothetical protein
MPQEETHTKSEKKRLKNVRTNMSEVFNAWVCKKNFVLNSVNVLRSMNPWSHRFCVYENIQVWNGNLGSMPNYITRRSTASTRKKKAMK